jgi:hypothetical protein
MRVSRSLSVLSLLAAASCAVGVELDPDLTRFDAGFDASHGGSHSGAAGASSPTGGRAGSGGSATGGSGPSGASTVTTGSGGAPSGGASVVDGSGGIATPDALGDVIVAVDTSNGCVPGQKVCGGRCVVPEARVGCDLVSCDPCPSPAHSVAICTGSECDFSCLAGFQRSGATCVPVDGGGGSAGSGGSGGSSVDSGPMHCVASMCSGCIPVIQAPCCKPDDTCGCQFPFFPCN